MSDTSGSADANPARALPTGVTGATIPDRRPIDLAVVVKLIARYDLGDLQEGPRPIGGTANLNVSIVTARGRFVLRRRHARYSAPACLAFDHALMERLAIHKLPTPLALHSLDSLRWTELGGDIYEVYDYRDGGPHDRTSLAQIRAAGDALGRYHAATEGWTPPPGKDWPRYDDPAQLIPSLADMDGDLRAAMSPEDHAYLMAQADRVARELPDSVYDSVPRQVIHGDYHPANVSFVGDQIGGIYDLDWATVQPQLRDIADGLIFFAGVRDGDVDSSDIRLLTRTWLPSTERSDAFLEAYARRRPVGDERALLPLFMRARWLYCRTIGRSKVPEDERIAYFTFGLLEPLRALDELERSGYFSKNRNRA